MNLLVKLVEHERGLVVLGVRAGDAPQRLPPGGGRQLPEQVLPESVRSLQDGNGLGGGGRRRVLPLDSARRPVHSQPLTSRAFTAPCRKTRCRKTAATRPLPPYP